MNHHQSLRLTPSNSPFFKTSTPRSPTKSRGEEPGLRLSKAIGTTTATINGFDSLPAARQFAYLAGAAAVVCTVQDDLTVTQRFFRARPTAGGWSQELNGHGPLSPTPNAARSRILGGTRDPSVSGSPLGAARDWSDSPGGKSATAKDRVKAATSVALSPNGKWVAVGETGYKPRVLVFSNKGESSEAPICSMAEHTFGVHALAFSPDSRYLASLGTVNDGFIYIWSIDSVTGLASLHSSNKCTVLVNAMIWIGRSLLTVGLRFVKCWRPDDEAINERRPSETFNNSSTPKQKTGDFGNSILSPRHKYLPGKNSLLGDLLDANFVSVLALSDDRAVICTDAGEICVLDDCHSGQTLAATALARFRITAAAVNSQGQLIVTGPGGKTKIVDVSELGSPLTNKPNRRQTIMPTRSYTSGQSALVARISFGEITVELDSHRGIRLSRSTASGEENQLAAHNEAVLGVQSFISSALPDASFLTFSTNGNIHTWTINGAHVANIDAPVETSPATYDVPNELRAVAASSSGDVVACGDRYGTLSILGIKNGTLVTQVRAHSAEIADIVAFGRSGAHLVATASRDRTVQLFTYTGDSLGLLQTMDEHSAAVSSLAVTKDGEMLLSCSTDRTVVVREAVRLGENGTRIAYAMLRTITLKTSPLAMCLKPDTDEIFVSSVDRSVGLYDIRSGQTGFSFKCSDSEGGDAAALSKILYVPSLNGNPTIVGVSNSDKSVRLYSEFGSLIARDWGHTEGVTDVALISAPEDSQRHQQRLVSVAADSTVFMWDTVGETSKTQASQPEANCVSETTPAKLSTPLGPPLRKVLSFSELSKFKREKAIENGIIESPSEAATPTHPPPSPPRVKKKVSRPSIAPTPKLEPAFRSSFAQSSRRESTRRRSPSPPSPRNHPKKDVARKPSLGMSLRSKSTDNVLTTAAAGGNSTFGSLNSSTESVCRTLRAYRKKLAGSSTSDSIDSDLLQDLEKELKLTVRAIGEKSQGKSFDEATISQLLDQASEKIVNRLGEKIKERVEDELRRSTDGSMSGPSMAHSPIPEEKSEIMDAVTGALQKASLEEG